MVKNFLGRAVSLFRVFCVSVKNMNSEPIVSICMPVLNARPFLDERMNSIMEQTLSDWELIVCDSYSDDGSWEFLQQFTADPRVKLHQVPKEGIYAGWNECLKRANGKYIYIATADDICGPELLGCLTGELEKNDDIDLAACRYQRIAEDGIPLPDDLLTPDLYRFLGEWADILHRRNRYAELLIMLCLDCQWNTLPALVFRRILLKKTGLFRTDMGSYADVAWRIKAILNSDLIYVPEVLASWRWHDKQATAALPGNRDELVYKCRRETLLECQELLPDDWDIEKALFWRKQHYLMHYHLNRTALKKSFGVFVKGATEAMVKEPKYFSRRMMTGLTWNAPEYGDPVEYLQELLEEWNIDWPPEK